MPAEDRPGQEILAAAAVVGKPCVKWIAVAPAAGLMNTSLDSIPP